MERAGLFVAPQWILRRLLATCRFHGCLWLPRRRWATGTLKSPMDGALKIVQPVSLSLGIPVLQAERCDDVRDLLVRQPRLGKVRCERQIIAAEVWLSRLRVRKIRTSQIPQARKGRVTFDELHQRRRQNRLAIYGDVSLPPGFGATDVPVTPGRKHVQQPLRNVGDRFVEAGQPIPVIAVPGPVEAGRDNDVAAVAANVQPIFETVEATKLDASRQAEPMMAAAGPRQRLPGFGELAVFGFQALQGFVSTLVHVDIEYGATTASAHSDIRVGPLLPPPSDLDFVLAGIDEAMFGTWMLAGVFAESSSGAGALEGAL